MVLLMDNDRVPSMHRFTIAMFVRADSKFKSGTLFGYSVEQNIGETILLYFSSLQIHLQIKDKTISADSIIADDQWHFVAGVWDGEEGVASLYFDGLQIGTKNNILKGSLMLGGGSISLGKRYLATEKKADASTFFSGTLHQVNVWSTAAQSDHMLLAAQSCTWPILKRLVRLSFWYQRESGEEIQIRLQRYIKIRNSKTYIIFLIINHGLLLCCCCFCFNLICT